MNNILIMDAYHEQCDALEREGYKPRFVSLAPIAYTILLAEAQHIFPDEVNPPDPTCGGVMRFGGKPVIVNPCQSEMVVVTTASSTEMLESITLAGIRRGLWIKHLKKEVEALRKATNHLTEGRRIDDGKE